uniref:Cupin-like domain-containing protein n=1 Tax=Haptolina brevifila TaxID=156173 RepID=A0A7S2BW24_9EUKA
MSGLFDCCSIWPLSTTGGAVEDEAPKPANEICKLSGTLKPCSKSLQSLQSGSSNVEELLASSSLAVLPQLTTNWTCRKWNATWVRNTLGHHEVQVAHKDATGNKVSYETVRLSHFLDNQTDRSWVPAGTIPYVDNFDIFTLAPERRAEVPSEKLFGPERTLVIYGAFLGPAGSSTRLHVDSEDNLIYCAFGRKLFILLPPSALELIGTLTHCCDLCTHKNSPVSGNFPGREMH